MNLPSGFRHIRTRTPLVALAFILFSWGLGYADPSIEGFRDLKFGMTKQEVVALSPCHSSTECLYELNEKNRYLALTYLPETTSGDKDSGGTSSAPTLAKITIDMGRYTDDWHQELQFILGENYRLTHDLTEQTMRAFLAEQQDELISGYEDGQVLLKVMRRPFGNMMLKVVYQNAALAKEFIQHTQAPASSPQ
jgi:hypothetical protein